MPLKDRVECRPAMALVGDAIKSKKPQRNETLSSKNKYCVLISLNYLSHPEKEGDMRNIWRTISNIGEELTSSRNIRRAGKTIRRKGRGDIVRENQEKSDKYDNDERDDDDDEDFDF